MVAHINKKNRRVKIIICMRKALDVSVGEGICISSLPYQNQDHPYGKTVHYKLIVFFVTYVNTLVSFKKYQ